MILLKSQQAASRAARTQARIAAVVDITERYAANNADLSGLSTTLVAQRAGLSVGWFYDNIGDRQALIDLVVARGLASMQEAIAMVGFDLSDSEWPIAADMLVDACFNYLRIRRGLARLYYSHLAGPSTYDLDFRLDQEGGAQLGLGRLPLEEAERRAVGSMMIGILDKGLELSFRTDEFDSPLFAQQTKLALRSYFGYLKGLLHE